MARHSNKTLTYILESQLVIPSYTYNFSRTISFVIHATQELDHGITNTEDYTLKKEL